MSVTRDNIDLAIDAWLMEQGVTKDEAMELDYGSIDTELNDLLWQVNQKRGEA